MERVESRGRNSLTHPSTDYAYQIITISIHVGAGRERWEERGTIERESNSRDGKNERKKKRRWERKEERGAWMSDEDSFRRRDDIDMTM